MANLAAGDSSPANPLEQRKMLGIIMEKMQEYREIAQKRESYIKDLEQKFKQMTATCKGYALELERLKLEQDSNSGRLAVELEVDHWKARCKALQSDLEEETERHKRERDMLSESNQSSSRALQRKLEKLQQENTALSTLLSGQIHSSDLQDGQPTAHRLPKANHGSVEIATQTILWGGDLEQFSDRESPQEAPVIGDGTPTESHKGAARSRTSKVARPSSAAARTRTSTKPKKGSVSNSESRVALMAKDFL